jgi:hypothetical protein
MDAHVERLSKDLKIAAATLSDAEARFLVDAYYLIQEDRKRSANQVRALDASQEPHLLLTWFAEQNELLESQLKAALDKYAQSKDIGKWAMDIYGVGPVITAGLIAHIDIKECPTVGHIWRFAGLDPSRKWAPKTKRPWNASLKTLCWKIGQSFMKFSNQEDCFYGKLYRHQKEKYIVRNDRGDNVARAAELLPKFDPKTEAHKWLRGSYPLGTSKALNEIKGATLVATTEFKANYLRSVRQNPNPKHGMLPPAHIDAMARRWVVKLFLSHFQSVWWEMDTGELPAKPYILTKEGGHAHEIRPPNWK